MRRKLVSCKSCGQNCTSAGVVSEYKACVSYKPRPTKMTTADLIRTMTDEELAAYITKFLVNYTSALYDGKYTPSDETAYKIEDELLRQLRQTYEEGVT